MVQEEQEKSKNNSLINKETNRYNNNNNKQPMELATDPRQEMGRPRPSGSHRPRPYTGALRAGASGKVFFDEPVHSMKPKEEAVTSKTT